MKEKNLTEAGSGDSDEINKSSDEDNETGTETGPQNYTIELINMRGEPEKDIVISIGDSEMMRDADNIFALSLGKEDKVKLAHAMPDILKNPEKFSTMIVSFPLLIKFVAEIFIFPEATFIS